MEPDELKAAFAEAKAQSLRLLERSSDKANINRRTHNADMSESSREMPKKAEPRSTVAEVQAVVDEKLKLHDEIWREVFGQVIAQERKRHRAEVEKLRSDHDLRICGLSHSVMKPEHGNCDRGEVIDLPMLPILRSRRHA